MSERPKVLVVEDEEKTARTVSLYLDDAGYEVLWASNGVEGLRLARSHSPDLVVLDLMLPEMDGVEVCRVLRSEGDIPILMLTARASENDRISGLDLGADDYVTKPFSPRELVSRIRAILRRTSRDKDEDTVLTFDGLALDTESFDVRVDGRPAKLTPTEFRLLETLVRSPRRVFSRVELIEIAIGDRFDGEDRAIDAHIRNLRRKLGQTRTQPGWIRTVFGLGYKLIARDELT